MFDEVDRSREQVGIPHRSAGKPVFVGLYNLERPTPRQLIGDFLIYRPLALYPR